MVREPHLIRPPVREGSAAGQPRRDRRSRAHQEGGRQQGEHRARDEDLLEPLVEESGRRGHRRQDEGELTGLGEGETRQDSQAEPLAKHERDHRDDDPRLQKDGGGREEEHTARVLEGGFWIEEHAHRGEEDAEQHAAKRNQLGEELMTVERRVHREPGQEGAHCEGQPDALGGDGGPHHHQHRDHAEQLLGAQLRHSLEQAGQEEARGHEEDGQCGSGADQSHEEGEGGGGRLPGENRDPQQEEHDADVLEEKDADDELTVGCVDLPPFGQKAHHQGRARHGHQQAQDQRGARRDAEKRGAGGDQDHGEAHLEPTRQQGDPPDSPEPFDGKLEGDLEEQEDHAELRQDADLLRIGDQADAPGPDQRTHHQEAGDGGKAKSLEERYASGGEGDQQDQLGQKTGDIHSSILLRGR